MSSKLFKFGAKLLNNSQFSIQQENLTNLFFCFFQRIRKLRQMKTHFYFFSFPFWVWKIEIYVQVKFNFRSSSWKKEVQM